MKKIYYLLSNLNLPLLFEVSLTSDEKEYCEREFNKFKNNPNKYKLPNLEKIIDNAELLKGFISYKIDQYYQENFEETYVSSFKLSKTL